MPEGTEISRYSYRVPNQHQPPTFLHTAAMTFQPRRGRVRRERTMAPSSHSETEQSAGGAAWKIRAAFRPTGGRGGSCPPRRPAWRWWWQTTQTPRMSLVSTHRGVCSASPRSRRRRDKSHACPAISGEGHDGGQEGGERVPNGLPEIGFRRLLCLPFDLKIRKHSLCPFVCSEVDGCAYDGF